MSSSYLTRLFSLRLLSEMLVNRANQEIMLRWVGDPENLKRIMIMMREKSRGVVKEALGVFKVSLHTKSLLRFS